MKNISFEKGIRDVVPIALGYFAVSFTLGIAARNAGLTPIQALLTSLLSHTSSGEFAGFSLMSQQVSYIEIAITTLILNMRYLLMSCAISQKATDMPLVHKLFISNFITDEIFALAITSGKKIDYKYMYGLIILASPAWVFGTYFGSLSGGLLPANVLSAMNLALYGMFIAIIIPPARENKTIAIIVVISMIASFLFTVLPILKSISSGAAIIILTIAISLLAAVLFPVDSEGHQINKTHEKEVVHCA